MALHYYGYQSCRRGSESLVQRRNVGPSSGTPAIIGTGSTRTHGGSLHNSEPPSESGESAGALSDLGKFKSFINKMNP